VNYAKNYEQALKLARAAEQGIRTFLKAAEGQPVHAHNTHDGVLADFLEEHDDPRHPIVRRHLEDTKHGGNGHSGASEEISRVLGGEFPQGRPEFLDSDGSFLTLYPHENPTTGQRMYHASLELHHVTPTWEFRGRRFAAALSPAEVERLREEFKPANPVGAHFAQPDHDGDHLPPMHSLPVDIS